MYKTIVVMQRNGEMHLADYCSIWGSKFTLCKKIFFKRDIINTIALDYPIHFICNECKNKYEFVYNSLEFNSINDISKTGSLLYSLQRKCEENKYFKYISQALGKRKNEYIKFKIARLTGRK